MSIGLITYQAAAVFVSAFPVVWVSENRKKYYQITGKVMYNRSNVADPESVYSNF